MSVCLFVWKRVFTSLGLRSCLVFCPLLQVPSLLYLPIHLLLVFFVLLAVASVVQYRFVATDQSFSLLSCFVAVVQLSALLLLLFTQTAFGAELGSATINLTSILLDHEFYDPKKH